MRGLRPLRLLRRMDRLYVIVSSFTLIVDQLVSVVGLYP